MAIKYTKEIQDARQLVFKDLIDSQTFKSCINCSQFLNNGGNEICDLNKLRPPARVIVYGCELHEFDIPF